MLLPFLLLIFVLFSVIIFCFYLWLKLYNLLFGTYEEKHRLPTHITIQRKPPTQANHSHMTNNGTLFQATPGSTSELFEITRSSIPVQVEKGSIGNHKRKHKRSLPTILETTISIDEGTDMSTSSSSSFDNSFQNSNNLTFALADLENQSVSFSTHKSEKRYLV
ncbi:hypothetical protein Fcan01_27212 [Folsomia candida]|uniref:Uncharacterized protein n=1 Tax=Folsomia candida TaxID=158441 RepID=A0A226D187_FOLCA|nr:hypothetical protein Fcan01_27212 [Folsomia candida]